MNKKIVSLVLAMCLSVGLGSSVNVFANAYSSYADEFNSSYAGKTEKGSVVVKVESGGSDNTLQGNLTAVFGYYAGTLVSIKQAGAGFTLYDSYGARFSVNFSGENGGIWTVQNISLRASDVAEMSKYIEQYGKVEGTKQFLMSMGMTEESLAVASMNENGELLDSEGNVLKNDNGEKSAGTGKISEEWCDKLLNTLKSGVNFTASVSMGTGMTGPTLTVSENGKTMASYQTNPEDGKIKMTNYYEYDNNGFMTGIVEAKFEMDSSENKTATGHWTQNYTKITYDSNGVRTDTTYQLFAWSSDPSSVVSSAKTATPENKEVSADTPALKTAVTKYSANNSMLYQTDFSTNNTTYYANNQPTYVVNETGATVELYDYTENGVIQAHFNANGKDKDGKVVGTTEIYDKWGRMLFTANGGLENSAFKNKTLRESLIAEYRTAITDGKGFKQVEYDGRDGESDEVILTGGTTISNFCVYADQVLANVGDAYKTNGCIDMKKVSAVLNNSRMLDTAKLNALGVNVKAFKAVGISGTGILNALKFNNGAGVALMQTQVNQGSWDKNKLPEGAVVDEDADTIEVTDTVGTVSKSKGTHRYHQIVDTEDAGDSRTVAIGTSYVTTYLFGGAQAYQTTTNVIKQYVNVKNVNAVLETDPAVEGSLWSPDVTDEELEVAIKEKGIDPNDEEAVSALKEELSEAKVIAKAQELGVDTNDEKAMTDLRNGFYTDANGQTFAIVSASSINIMDGSGFQPVEGETVMVAVDNTTKQQVIDTVNRTGDRSIMFMGDVRESTTGYLTMTMNTNYGGGVAQGSATVQQVKNEIAETSMKVASARYQYENGNMSEAEYNKIVKDAGWVGTNTDANLTKFANGGFTWDNDKTATQNIRDAWQLLLNF